MSGINEIAQNASSVKISTPTVTDTAPIIPASSVPVPTVIEQEQKVRQDAAVAGKQIPISVDAEPEAANDEQVLQAVHDMREYAQSIDRDLKFNVDDDSGRLIITVIDPETDKIVRQIPPEETLHILRNMERGAGTLFNNKV